MNLSYLAARFRSLQKGIKTIVSNAQVQANLISNLYSQYYAQNSTISALSATVSAQATQISQLADTLASMPKVHNMDIYIQPSLPSVPGDFVWIPTDVNHIVS